MYISLILGNTMRGIWSATGSLFRLMKKMLPSVSEEYAVHDTENFPIEIGEYISIEELNEMFEMIEELPDYITDELDEFISHYGSLEEVYDHKDDVYCYSDCETMTDVAYYFIDEMQMLGEIPPQLQNYIDYEAYGRDLSFEGTFIETSYGMCEILW